MVYLVEHLGRPIGADVVGQEVLGHPSERRKLELKQIWAYKA